MLADAFPQRQQDAIERLDTIRRRSLSQGCQSQRANCADLRYSQGCVRLQLYHTTRKRNAIGTTSSLALGQ